MFVFELTLLNDKNQKITITEFELAVLRRILRTRHLELYRKLTEYYVKVCENYVKVCENR